jgi:hypothetical protein
VGPTFRGFGVQDFGVYEHLMHKQNEIRNASLQNEKGMWAQHFGVSRFGISGLVKKRNSVHM